MIDKVHFCYTKNRIKNIFIYFFSTTCLHKYKHFESKIKYEEAVRPHVAFKMFSDTVFFQYKKPESDIDKVLF